MMLSAREDEKKGEKSKEDENFSCAADFYEDQESTRRGRGRGRGLYMGQDAGRRTACFFFFFCCCFILCFIFGFVFCFCFFSGSASVRRLLIIAWGCCSLSFRCFSRRAYQPQPAPLPAGGWADECMEEAVLSVPKFDAEQLELCHRELLCVDFLIDIKNPMLSSIIGSKESPGGFFFLFFFYFFICAMQ